MSKSHETMDVRQDGHRVLATERATLALASDGAAARLTEAVDLFRSGGRPSLDAGWFPLGRPPESR